MTASLGIIACAGRRGGLVGERFDMVVIGSGPAGEKAAAQAAYFGKRVAVVERSPRPGGAAVSTAGVPTKTLRETALYITGFRRREVYGVSLHLDPEATLERLRARTAEVVETMTSSVERNLERHRIELVRGQATLLPDRQVLVRGPDGRERTLAAEVVLIATGSHPFHPSQIPFGDPDVHDSEEILTVERPFRSVVVLGRGIVGCEYASILTAVGVEVTLVGGGPLAPVLDAELSRLLAEALARGGVRLHLGGGRAAVARDADGLRVTLPDGEVLRPEKVLLAAGRAGNTEGLGLEAAGVAVDARHRVLVDDTYRTSAPGVYAAGDVIGPPVLASASMEQGRVAACYAFGIPFKETVDPLAPYGVYTIPEAAMVGLTEEAAAERGLDHEVGRGWFAANARATIAGATDGLVKLVFARADRRLLGVHVLGEDAAELIHLGQAAVHFGATIDYFIHTTFNVPTRSEAYKYAAYDGLQRLQRAEGGGRQPKEA
jgi:NAD(P) transhydrogenase